MLPIPEESGKTHARRVNISTRLLIEHVVLRMRSNHLNSHPVDPSLRLFYARQRSHTLRARHRSVWGALLPEFSGVDRNPAESKQTPKEFLSMQVSSSGWRLEPEGCHILWNWANSTCFPNGTAVRSGHGVWQVAARSTGGPRWEGQPDLFFPRAKDSNDLKKRESEHPIM